METGASRGPLREDGPCSGQTETEEVPGPCPQEAPGGTHPPLLADRKASLAVTEPMHL